MRARLYTKNKGTGQPRRQPRASDSHLKLHCDSAVSKFVHKCMTCLRVGNNANKVDISVSKQGACNIRDEFFADRVPTATTFESGDAILARCQPLIDPSSA